MSLRLTDLFDGCIGNHSDYFEGGYYIEEVTFIIISILWVYVYLKVRSSKKHDSPCYVNNDSLDILMQPKKEISKEIEKPPFSQFSLKTVYSLFGISILFFAAIFFVIRNLL